MTSFDISNIIKSFLNKLFMHCKIPCCGIFEKNEWVQWPFLCPTQFNKIKNLLIQTIAPLVSKMYIFGHSSHNFDKFNKLSTILESETYLCINLYHCQSSISQIISLFTERGKFCLFCNVSFFRF